MSRLITSTIYNYRKALRNELLKRQKINSRYSLRAFARDLNLSSSGLCEVLSGTKALSVARSLELVELLRFNTQEAKAFLNSVVAFDDRNELRRYEAFLLLKQMQNSSTMVGIDEVDPKSLQGVWKATLRASSTGKVPQFWDPTKTQTYFLFKGSQIEYTSRNLETGQFHIYGKWEYENDRIYTPTNLCEVFGRPKTLPFPWLAVSHQVMKLDENSFCLSTPSVLLESPICPKGESLETIWERVL